MPVSLTKTDPGFLSLTDVLYLAMVLEAPQGNKTVARVLNGEVYWGTARSVGTENGCSDWHRDVRDQFLRVTLIGGTDVFWPIRELMTEVASGMFVPDYQR